jgi:hypothetical protein
MSRRSRAGIRSDCGQGRFSGAGWAETSVHRSLVRLPIMQLPRQRGEAWEWGSKGIVSLRITTLDSGPHDHALAPSLFRLGHRPWQGRILVGSPNQFLLGPDLPRRRGSRGSQATSSLRGEALPSLPAATRNPVCAPEIDCRCIRRPTCRFRRRPSAGRAAAMLEFGPIVTKGGPRRSLDLQAETP